VLLGGSKFINLLKLPDVVGATIMIQKRIQKYGNTKRVATLNGSKISIL